MGLRSHGIVRGGGHLGPRSPMRWWITWSIGSFLFIASKGLRWYARSLKIDEDGDVADEFLHEVLPDTQLHVEENQRPLAKLEVKYSTRPVKVKSQSLSVDGKIQQCVEYQGRLQWV